MGTKRHGRLGKDWTGQDGQGMAGADRNGGATQGAAGQGSAGVAGRGTQWNVRARQENGTAGRNNEQKAQEIKNGICKKRQRSS